MKLGAFPWFALARSLCAAGGDGLFKIAIYGIRGRRTAYLSYGGGVARGRFVCWRGLGEDVEGSAPKTARLLEVEDEGSNEDDADKGGCAGARDGEGEGGESDLIISLWRRGMKPGSMAVPPETRMDDARVFRRSTGI